MDPSDVSRAIAAARAVTAPLGVPVDDAVVLHDSNRLTVRLLPCDLVARIAFVGRDAGAFEVELAQRLDAAGSPSGTLDRRFEPRVHEHDGFAVTFWTFYEPLPPPLPPADYADALVRLHTSMRAVDMPTPHFTDRVASAERIVTSAELAPELATADRELLVETLRRVRTQIEDRGAPEQLLHGEPHPGNLLRTAAGPRFVDLETGCRGPVEFDLAHVPESVSRLYPGVDEELLRLCRQLALAVVAAWRWELGDQLPNGERAGRDLIDALRSGPPWPTLDELFGRLDGSTS